MDDLKPGKQVAKEQGVDGLDMAISGVRLTEAQTLSRRVSKQGQHPDVKGGQLEGQTQSQATPPITGELEDSQEGKLYIWCSASNKQDVEGRTEM